MVPDSWGRSHWQPRHQVLTRLARFFHVVWVDQAENWRELRFLPGRGLPPVAPPSNAAFAVYHPSRFLPALYRPQILAEKLRRTRWRAASSMLARRGCRKIVLYLWRPDFHHALDDVPYDKCVYHIDDEYSFSETPEPVSPAEEAILRRSDLVIIHSSGLMKKKGCYNRNTVCVPNGVDFAAYSTPHAIPSDLQAAAPPRIGYIGVIKGQLDWPLLSDLAERNPTRSFVYIGPRGWIGEAGEIIERMEKRPNVYFLGGKPLTELPAYTQHVDVGMLPYRINPYTNAIYPLKLHEYLSCGKPAVGTGITTLLEYRNLVTIAAGPDEWSRAIDLSLTPEENTAEAAARRRAVAKQHDWDVLVERIAIEVRAVLGG
jgi:glycosyltransferase involved in cell wall biosynthesis